MLLQKFTFRLCFTILIAFTLTSVSQSQTDSIKVSYGEELKDSSDYKYRRVYQYLDINMKDEKRMFKVSPGFNITKSYNLFDIQVGYEFKLLNQYSVQLNNFHTVRQVKNLINHDKTFYFTSLSLDFRYYYTLKKRLRNGLSGNNLNGVYFGLGLNDFASFGQGYYRSRVLVIYDIPYKLNINKPDLRLSAGIQKRINNWSFFDIYTHISYIGKSIDAYLGFRLGLAWGNKK